MVAHKLYGFPTRSEDSRKHSYWLEQGLRDGVAGLVWNNMQVEAEGSMSSKKPCETTGGVGWCVYVCVCVSVESGYAVCH